MTVFDRLESQVRSYCRSFPAVFDRASGPYLYDVEGRRYLDFFCGAGSLNYGHNPPAMKRALIRYLEADGIIHALDMSTAAKAAFLEAFEATVLQPRGLDYRVQFTGPTGANAVEAALKLARKVTKRRNIVAFTRGYHGLSLGALAVTANTAYRDESFVNRQDVMFMPYEGFLGPDVDTLALFERYLEEDNSGLGRPAAVLVETIQAEGGVHLASATWLRGLEALCRRFEMLLIVDDIQVGCGRAGSFFSFEDAGVRPDLVTLSKSISGYGLPMSLLLITPSADQWRPGEHTGTFRGNNAAFVTATEALRYWQDGAFSAHLGAASATLDAGLRRLAETRSDLSCAVRGRGLIFGFDSGDIQINAQVARECFSRGLIIELCGTRQVLKFLPPLTITHDELTAGLQIVEESLDAVARRAPAARAASARW